MSQARNRKREAAIYTRISDDKRRGTADEGLGVERQETACRKWASEHGYTITRIYSDNDISASSGKLRPAFEQLLRDHPDHVIVWHNDRLLRKSTRDLERVLDTGCMVHALTAGEFDLATPTGRAMARTVTAWAQQEVEHKAERQVEANIQRAVQGKKVNGGRRSFGYDLDMSVRRDEAEMVVKGYEWFLAGVALKEIARRWNESGFTTPQATRRRDDREPEPSPWAGDTVRRCLMKPVYAGLLTYRGKDYGTGTWTPLVNVETWSDAQAIFKDPSRKPVHGKQRLLSGVARCGICGNGTTVNAGGGRTGLGVYACSGPVKHLTRRRDHIDEFVRAHVIERLSLPDAAGLFMPDDPGDRRTITARLAEIDDKLDGLAALYARGILNERSVEKQSIELREERAELETQLHTTDPILGQGRALASADDIEAAWDALPTDIQRQLIDRLMVVWIDRPVRGARRFDPETVRIEWRG